MKISDDLLFEQTRGLALAIAFLSFVVSGCVSHEAGLGQEAGDSARQAADVLAKARHTHNTSTRIGLMLAAADKAGQSIAESDAPEACTLYNTACAELAVLLKKSSSAPTLPAMLSTPAGPYVLKFDNTRNSRRWEPNYFRWGQRPRYRLTIDASSTPGRCGTVRVGTVGGELDRATRGAGRHAAEESDDQRTYHCGLGVRRRAVPGAEIMTQFQIAGLDIREGPVAALSRRTREGWTDRASRGAGFALQHRH